MIANDQETTEDQSQLSYAGDYPGKFGERVELYKVTNSWLDDPASDYDDCHCRWA